MPSNIVLNKVYQKLLKNKTIKKERTLEQLLVKRKVRSLSGIAIVSSTTRVLEKSSSKKQRK